MRVPLPIVAPSRSPHLRLPTCTTPLVEQGGFAHLECLERRWRAPSPRPTVGRQGRPRAEGHKLLWALSAQDGRGVAEIRGRKTGKLHNATRFLAWCTEKLRDEGKKFLLLIWDNAGWHLSQELRRWFGKHDGRIKVGGEGVGIICCLLPKQSPWLSAIEPVWVQLRQSDLVWQPAGSDQCGTRAGSRKVTNTDGSRGRES
jgi:hypothetical protein